MKEMTVEDGPIIQTTTQVSNVACPQRPACSIFLPPVPRKVEVEVASVVGCDFVVDNMETRRAVWRIFCGLDLPCRTEV